MTSRKWAAALAATALTLSVAGTALAAPNVPGAVYSDQQAIGTSKPVTQIQQELQQAGIQDVKPTDWYAGSVTVVVQAGLLKPAADGSFQPEATLKADEGVAVFAKVLGIAAKNDTPEQAVAKAQEAGLVGGTVTADKDLTRLETARLLATALGVEPKAVLNPVDYPFADFEGVSPEDRGMLKALYDLGIFKGYPEENGKVTFRPDNVLTRAQIALLIDRILGTSR
ncbi:MAG: S-layer homology domain-containing protein [Mycobacterium leprae]